jgi:hypothetical protein
VFSDHAISDTGGNGDGYLDAGEAVDLIVTLRNLGEPAEGITAALFTDDPYITLVSSVASYADMPTGGSASNGGNPFALTADSATPEGHAVSFEIIVSYDGGETVSTFALTVGRSHYLVWDPTADTSSGPVIASTLSSRGYSGDIRQTLPVDQLDRFQTLWVSLGMSPHNYLIAENSMEAFAIVSYLEAGGLVFMEGGDVWYFDPIVGGHDFRPYFGLDASDDGTADCGMIAGRSGTFTEDVIFSYVGENVFVDHLNVSAPTSNLILVNKSPFYGVGVSYDQGLYRTVGTSFEFAGLADGLEPSTKAELAQRIMDFFLPPDTGIDDGELEPALAGLAAYPNPFNPKTSLAFTNPSSGRVRLAVYDCTGRLVRVLADERMSAGPQEIVWDGRNSSGRPLSSGVYFARLVGEEVEETRKLVMLK